MKKINFTLLLMFLAFSGFAQNNINTYKYIIIPTQFEFSNAKDQYQLNSLTKFLFNKHGYTAYFMNDALPEDLKANRCLALTSEVSKEKSGLFKTKLELILKDCNGQIVMTSQIGESRLKDYKKAYTQALRAAFITYQYLEYTYTPKATDKPFIETLSKAKAPVLEKESEVLAVENEIIETVTEAKSTPIPRPKVNNQLYYAQPIKQGFQLVDAQPKVVMILLTTAAKDVFVVKDKNAIVFKAGTTWMYSENNGVTKIESPLEIKF